MFVPCARLKNVLYSAAYFHFIHGMRTKLRVRDRLSRGLKYYTGDMGTNKEIKYAYPISRKFHFVIQGKHFQCAVCSKTFISHDNLLRHRSTAHRGDELTKTNKIGGQWRHSSNKGNKTYKISGS